VAHPPLLKSHVDYCADVMIFEIAVKEFSGATHYSVQFPVSTRMRPPDAYRTSTLTKKVLDTDEIPAQSLSINAARCGLGFGNVSNYNSDLFVDTHRR
jgi:hypothetical protein